MKNDRLTFRDILMAILFIMLLFVSASTFQSCKAAKVCNPCITIAKNDSIANVKYSNGIEETFNLKTLPR